MRRDGKITCDMKRDVHIVTIEFRHLYCTVYPATSSIPHQSIDNMLDSKLLEICIGLSDTDEVDWQAGYTCSCQRSAHFVVDYKSEKMDHDEVMSVLRRIKVKAGEDSLVSNLVKSIPSNPLGLLTPLKSFKLRSNLVN